MPNSLPVESDFIKKLIELINSHLNNDQFGVSELATEVGMSRSNLLRKVKKETGLSVSQFIRQVRLEQAHQILQKSDQTVSEVAYMVGSGSPSYFIKCFNEHYGYSPGETNERISQDASKLIQKERIKTKVKRFSGISFIIAIISILIIIFYPKYADETKEEISIAVLPFINDSNDSTNVYIINGLMESILINLQAIEDVRVISRTTAEKYRSSNKSIQDIAKELDVKYLVEGSGQKIGDAVMLNIQLIEGKYDRHLWAEQYSRNVTDIFKLQQEVSKEIAAKIQVTVSPEVQARIEKIPTESLVAYDYFLQGLDLMRAGDYASLDSSVRYFKKAIEEDPEYANAYADLAIAYYFLDEYQTEKKYLNEINTNADQAMFYDPELPQSMIAKALYYMNTYQYDLAIPFFEKALEINPNLAIAFTMLADFYANHDPNTEKYLEYALKGLKIDFASNDHTDASYMYLHISNAFAQTGFFDLAEIYIDKSLEKMPENLFSQYVKAYFHLVKTNDFETTVEMIKAALEKDTTRLDIVQEVGKMYFYMRDYEMALKYYEPFVVAKETFGLNIFRGEDAKIGHAYKMVGNQELADKYFEQYYNYVQQDQSIFKELSYCVYYTYKGEHEKAIEHLQKFSEEDDYYSWITYFLKIDPLLDDLQEYPEFHEILEKLDEKFWERHEEIKKRLQSEGLI